MTPARWASAVVLGAALSALFWIDPLFIPLALAGPLVVGAFAGAKQWPWRWPAVVFAVAGVGAVVSDWIVNEEDVGFHLVLTVVMVVLAVGAWAAARALGTRRGATTEPRSLTER